MPVNSNLAYFSDLSYRTAFVIYVIGLVIALVYYIRRSSQVAAETTGVRERELVGAAGTGTVAGDPPPPPVGNAGPVHGVDKLGGMVQSMLWLGLILQGASIVLRGLSAGRFPWGNLYEYISLVTFLTMAIAALVIQRKDLRAMWPWLLVPVLILMFYGGTKLHVASGPVVPALRSFWLPIHVSIVSFGAGICMLSGVASMLYLFRQAQPKGEERGRIGEILRPLPGADTLDRIAYRAATWAVPVFGLGVILGALWAESAWGRFWGWDPKETMSFVTWILYAAYLHARSTPSWRKAAPWINIAGLAAMVFNLFFINLVTAGLHSYAGLAN
ncbi:c-type cytochrome biogenesis protein CcsB [Corynebacterium meridianum]|uniref:C-type cytochrome biogenesis protein CcsB n=1 Tax=Corynebacterium meridianum TaxID=2765363 RepID=A0A934HZS7_9CORY|nr:c-type cytochrome biogenesis protein CcsB [Corynebacterium meridianum]MBI8989983.1 c-type cytochrome biogenesis protein CcsB [Corynebacterium meridianum]